MTWALRRTTETRSENLFDVLDMVGESDAVDGQPSVPEGPVYTVNVSVGEGLPTLDDNLNQGDVECMENDATTVPQMANGVDASAQCSTSARSNKVCDEILQSTREDTNAGAGILEIDVQNVSQSFASELLQPITIGVDVSGRSQKEKALNDYAVSSRVMSANVNCFRAKVNTPASLCADFPELVPFNGR